MTSAPSTTHRFLDNATRVFKSGRRRIGILILPLVSVIAIPASACPICHTETAQKIRHALFGPDFWFNIGVTILPFAIFLSITALIYYGFPTAVRHPKPKRSKVTVGEAL
jgi:hypothetical protein